MFYSFILLFVFSIPALAQGDGEAARPSDEAAIDPKVPVYRDVSDKLNELLKLPAPKVVYSFDGNKTPLTDLSADSKAVLDEHWKAALSYFYSDVFLRPADPQQFSERSREWMRFGNGSRQSLIALKIAAPNGERNISQSEADATVAFVNRVASSVVNKAKAKYLEK